MWRFAGPTGIGIVLLLGGLESSYGFEEIGNWETIWSAPEGSALPPYVDAKDEIWTAAEGHLYHLKGGEVERSEDLIPLASELNELAIVVPNKGWAITNTALLAYDGVFWTVVPGVGGASGAHLISVIDENEVWFANGYKYLNGRYEKFSETRFSSIRMLDSQNGVAIKTGNRVALGFVRKQLIDFFAVAFYL